MKEAIETEQRRDGLLLRLLKTPPQPRPKKAKVKGKSKTSRAKQKSA